MEAKELMELELSLMNLQGFAHNQGDPEMFRIWYAIKETRDLIRDKIQEKIRKDTNV